MAINLTSTEVLLLITDLILMIIVVYLLDRLRKIKKSVEPAEMKQSPETVVPLEVKPDLSVVKIEVQEKAEPKPGDQQTALASLVSSEPAPKKDELEDRLLEELHAIPSEVKPETETAEPVTLKLEDEPPEENPADTESESGDTKPGKVRKPRKKRSKSKKTASTAEAASGKKAGGKKKATEPAVQMAETKPAQEAVKEEKAEIGAEEDKPEIPMEPQKDSLF